MSAALLERGRALRSPRPPLPPSPPPDYLAPFLPPSQSALASLSLSASLLFSPSPSHLLTSSYLQQRRRHYSPSAWSSLLSSLSSTTTLYVGNLAFTTREETVHHLFSLCGRIQSLYMGLNAQTHVPCGFCFIRFHTAEAAQRARWMINGMKVDGRVCGVDFDQEFREGRQWGRGKTGGQIRDDHRSSYDEGRGGWGTRERLKQQMRRMQEQQVTQFESISEGGKKATDEEDDSGGGGGAQLQQQKREKGSYKQANAMRKAVAGTTTVGAAVASMKREGMEATMNEEPTSQCHSRYCCPTAAPLRPALSSAAAGAGCAVQASGGEWGRRNRTERQWSSIGRKGRALLSPGHRCPMERCRRQTQVGRQATSGQQQAKRGLVRRGLTATMFRCLRARIDLLALE